MPNIASHVIEISYIERYIFRLIDFKYVFKLLILVINYIFPSKADFTKIEICLSQYTFKLKPLFEASLLVLLDAKLTRRL